MKYIMLITEHGQKLPIVFPDALTHSVVAQVMSAAVEICANAKAKVSSAGFVSLGTDVEVYGDSESLGIKHVPADASRIMVGDSIAFMPDAMATAIMDKLKAKKSDD